MTLRLVSAVALPHSPDPLTLCIKLDLLTRQLVGRRLALGARPEIDEELDKLIVLRNWTARRLVN